MGHAGCRSGCSSFLTPRTEKSDTNRHDASQGGQGTPTSTPNRRAEINTDTARTDITIDLTSDISDELVRLEIENALEQMDGVQAVRLVPGTNRPVDELHAVVEPHCEPKHVARDLQTMLLAQFGVDIDRRVISVVRLGSAATARLTEVLPRLTLDCVNVAVRANDTSVSIEVFDSEGGTAVGSAGPIRGDAVIEGAALATVNAINTYLGSGSARLIDAHIARAGGHHVAVVVVEVYGGPTTRVLTGSALVRRQEADAVARAVLDATNRIQRV
jgi:hypothetical protein